jgi:DNA-binding IclR family transcriptional regulator
MAFAPKAFQDEIFGQGMERVTPATIVKREQLLEEFAAIRAQGYAISKGELVYEVGGIAAPVYNYDRQVVAALTVAGPMQRFTDQLCREKLKDLLEATDRLSRLLGFEEIHIRVKR